MPRIRKKAEQYRAADFIKALDHARVDEGFRTVAAVADAAQIPRTTLWRRWQKDPYEMTLRELFQLLQVLPVPVKALLAFLGVKYKEEENRS